MEVGIIILAMIVALLIIALMRELRRPVPVADQSERDQALADLNNERIRVGQLEEAERRQEKRIEELEKERDDTQAERDKLSNQNADLKVELGNAKTENEANERAFEAYREQLLKQFTGIAANVTQSTREEFIKEFRDLTKQQSESAQKLVGETVKPLRESLDKLEAGNQAIEKQRAGAYSEVETLIKTTQTQLAELQSSTGNLRRALAAPQQRGRWGELTLERVLEVSGMLEHVTYERQHQTTSNGRALRPDAVIHLPRGLTVPVDAKTPLDSYLRAHESDDDQEQRAALTQHAKQLMDHARQLGSKGYAGAIAGDSPDFVVLFVPTETILDAAMTAQPTIWEDAWSQHRVLIASPGLLIALLRTIGVAWQQEQIQRDAQEIASAARELYSRLSTYTEHISTLGGALERAVKAYNSSIGSYEGRVLPQARRMEGLGVVADTQRIPDPESVEITPRQLTAPEATD